MHDEAGEDHHRTRAPLSAKAVYRRGEGCVFRGIRGTVLVTGPGRDLQRLDGVAAAVWLALWSPCSADELLARLHAAGPDLVGQRGLAEPERARRPGLAHEAVTLLVAADLVAVDMVPAATGP